MAWVPPRVAWASPWRGCLGLAFVPSRSVGAIEMTCGRLRRSYDGYFSRARACTFFLEKCCDALYSLPAAMRNDCCGFPVLLYGLFWVSVPCLFFVLLRRCWFVENFLQLLRSGMYARRFYLFA